MAGVLDVDAPLRGCRSKRNRSQHYDVPISYVGHVETWDTLTVESDIAANDCLLRYGRNGRVLAVASMYRDVENLQAELAMEQGALGPVQIRVVVAAFIMSERKGRIEKQFLVRRRAMPI
jgi:hypothetical protein